MGPASRHLPAKCERFKRGQRSVPNFAGNRIRAMRQVLAAWTTFSCPSGSSLHGRKADHVQRKHQLGMGQINQGDRRDACFHGVSFRVPVFDPHQLRFGQTVQKLNLVFASQLRQCRTKAREAPADHRVEECRLSGGPVGLAFGEFGSGRGVGTQGISSKSLASVTMIKTKVGLILWMDKILHHLRSPGMV